jgi:dephospho-CoA kinase
LLLPGASGYQQQVLIVGLTGGIGAGKSTVARLLQDRGATVIDVDAIGRAVIEPGGRAYDAVVEAFGPSIVDADGRIDRTALARIVFSDAAQLERLTGISHPAINAELVGLLDALPRDATVVLDMAILAEGNLGRPDPEHSYEFVVTVEAPSEERIARAVARGMTEDDARRRMQSQASEDERRALADVVIVNDGSQRELEAKVGDLWTRLRRCRSTGTS